MAGITITEDEADKKIRGAREIRREIAREGGAQAMEKLAAMDLTINRTKIVSRKKVAAGAENTDPDPKDAYRMVNRAKEGERIALLQGLGYETVPEDDDAHLVMSSKRDGVQVQGDLVLMRLPVELHEARRRAKRMKYVQASNDRVNSAKENMNRIAREGGLTGPHKDAVIE